MHVCVLGAGIVGLSTAYALNLRGHKVSVVDRAGVPGSGASGGNGAQLSYSYVQPLADPGIWRQLPQLLLSPSSPLKVRPRLDPQQWRWALEFLRACNGRTSVATTLILLELAEQSRVAFEAMRADLAPDCDYSDTGKLVLYRSAAGLAGAARQLELQREYGSSQRILTPDDCVAVEPALKSYLTGLAGAVHTPSENTADCLKVCQVMTKALTARGVDFLFSTCADSFEIRANKVHSLRIRGGAITADCYVLAAGSGSHGIARQIGVRLPVYPLKGYSLTLDVAGLEAGAPLVSVTDNTLKVVFARLGRRIRVAGMAEIVGYDSSIPSGRIEALRDATRKVFPDIENAPELERWTGMRPATPTGRPIVGRLALAPSNLLFNTGHGALGFTLAFGTAKRLADLIDRNNF